MPDTLAVDIKASLSWLYQEHRPVSTLADTSKVDYFRRWTDGVGVDQADQLWHDERTLDPSTQDDLDLTILTASIHNNSVIFNFAKVKAIMIVNTATTPGADLIVGGGGTAGDAFAAPFDGDANSKVLVPADSMLLLCNRKSSWTVQNNVSDILRVLAKPVATITYRIAIVGTTM